MNVCSKFHGSFSDFSLDQAATSEAEKWSQMESAQKLQFPKRPLEGQLQKRVNRHRPPYQNAKIQSRNKHFSDHWLSLTPHANNYT